MAQRLPPFPQFFPYNPDHITWVGLHTTHVTGNITPQNICLASTQGYQKSTCSLSHPLILPNATHKQAWPAPQHTLRCNQPNHQHAKNNNSPHRFHRVVCLHTAVTQAPCCSNHLFLLLLLLLLGHGSCHLLAPALRQLPQLRREVLVHGDLDAAAQQLPPGGVLAQQLHAVPRVQLNRRHIVLVYVQHQVALAPLQRLRLRTLQHGKRQAPSSLLSCNSHARDVCVRFVCGKAPWQHLQYVLEVLQRDLNHPNHLLRPSPLLQHNRLSRLVGPSLLC
mmetsp:Transcript_6648/g.14688  ORF Transcript_6648/g.14688 Transcript_6648/m.14688 type:complete len:278 (+) Transcript_6648:319-1152(+)